MLEEKVLEDPKAKQFCEGLTYTFQVDQIPDEDYIFGFDTHHDKYGMAFAEYLLQQSGLTDPLGPDPGLTGTEDSRNRKIAFALGYYAHLAEDIACHNFLVPRITAQLDLGDFELVKNSTTFVDDPNAQTEAIIETIVDNLYGNNSLVASTVYRDIWISYNQFEPTVAQVNPFNLIYNGEMFDPVKYGTSLNPVIVFFDEVAKKWYNENPFNLPTNNTIEKDNYRLNNAPLSLTGTYELATLFRFVNRFYPALVGQPFEGKSTLPQVFSDWIYNHLDYKDGWEGFLVLADIIGLRKPITGLAYPGIIEGVKKDIGADVRIFLSLMLSNMTEATNYANEHPEIINISEFNRLKNSILFTNPHSVLDAAWSEYSQLGARIYSEVGPDGKWYSDWSPWHSQSMAWGALSSLNNRLTSLYASNPDVAVYDAYIKVGTKVIKGFEPPRTFENNPVTKAIIELYNTKDVSSKSLKLQVKKDHISSNYSSDPSIANSNFSIDQNPINYNTVARVKKEQQFNISQADLTNYNGYYYEVVDNSNNKPVFTSSFEQYANNLQLTANYNKIYDTYTKWPFSLGVAKSVCTVSLLNGEVDGAANSEISYTINNINTNSTSVIQNQYVNLAATAPSGFNFIEWSDGNKANPRVYNVQSNIVLKAKYKKSQVSGDVSAYSANSQRKIVRTMDGWLHQVYSSMNHVWIEHSSNGGTSWFIGNNGKPLDNGEGKNPSIDWWYGNSGKPIYNYVVVFQQKKADNTYTIQYITFAKQTDGTYKAIKNNVLYDATDDNYSSNCNPNITVGGRGENNSMGDFVLTFEKKNGVNTGINWIYGHIDEGGLGAFDRSWSCVNWYNKWSGPHLIQGTNANSKNAAVSLNKQLLYEGNFSIAFEQYNSASSSSIKVAYCYCRQADFGNVSAGWNWTSGTPNIISASTGAVNQKPSMVQMPDGNIKVCWIRNVTTQYVIPYYINAVYYNSANSQYIYSGIFARNVSINTSNNNAKTLFAWSQDLSGWENYISNGVTNIKLNTTGQDVQVCNGTDAGTNMLVSSFNRLSAPYYFKNTGNIGGSLSKAGSNINYGRGLALNKDDMQFSYTIKSLSVAGTNIRFVEIPENAPDTTKDKNRGVKYLKIDELNKYLLSEPFSIQEGTAFEFSDDAGFIDAETASEALGEKGTINCKIELIDDVTDKVIGLVNESEYSTADILQGKLSNYTLNTEGLKNTTARVKITISSNIKDLQGVFVSEYGTIDKETLAKASATELTLQKDGVITEYALEQNYPNPFNPSTTIKYQIPENGMVTLKIFNILGEEVATLVNGFKNAGRYEVKFDASNLASGVYVYQLTSGSFNASHKMLLLK